MSSVLAHDRKRGWILGSSTPSGINTTMLPTMLMANNGPPTRSPRMMLLNGTRLRDCTFVAVDGLSASANSAMR
jgi:hypothetical protein